MRWRGAESAHLAGAEGLCYCERAVCEITFGRDDLDGNVVGRMPVKRQRSFERRNASTGDDDLETRVVMTFRHVPSSGVGCWPIFAVSI